MDFPEYSPPNDAVGLALVLVVSIAAGLSMKYVVENRGAVGEVLVVPILFAVLGLLAYLSSD